MVEEREEKKYPIIKKCGPRERERILSPLKIGPIPRKDQGNT